MKNRSQHATVGTLLVIAAVVGTILSWTAGPLAGTPASASPGGGGAPPHANPVFARNVTGTWLADPGTPFQSLHNIRADGTLDWWGTWFFGNGTGNFLDGPVFCTWKQTGPLELTTIELGFLFDGDGNFEAIGRVREVYTFSPDFQSFTATGTEDLFWPDQDPTDPNAEPFLSFNFAYGPAKRLNHGIMD